MNIYLKNHVVSSHFLFYFQAEKENFFGLILEVGPVKWLNTSGETTKITNPEKLKIKKFVVMPEGFIPAETLVVEMKEIKQIKLCGPVWELYTIETALKISRKGDLYGF